MRNNTSPNERNTTHTIHQCISSALCRVAGSEETSGMLLRTSLSSLVFQLNPTSKSRVTSTLTTISSSQHICSTRLSIDLACLSTSSPTSHVLKEAKRENYVDVESTRRRRHHPTHRKEKPIDRMVSVQASYGSY